MVGRSSALSYSNARVEMVVPNNSIVLTPGSFARAGAGHRVRGYHDRMQWAGRALHHGRKPAPSRAGISGFGREPVSQCSRRALCPNVDLAELHLNN
jgi:hypothetical protein